MVILLRNILRGQTNLKTLIIGISGKRGVGKTTAANYLVEIHRFKKVSFGDKLKEMAGWLLPFKPIDFSPSGKEKKFMDYDWTPREFLINFGQFMRYHDPEYWLKYSDVDQDTKGKIVIDDVRFPNEVDYLKSLGAKIIRINRFENLNIYGKDLNDPSETSLDDYKGFDYVIESSRNIKKTDLYDQMATVLKEFED